MSITKLIALSVALLAISCKGNMEADKIPGQDYAQPVYPNPETPAPAHYYGSSVALSGDTMVIGVPGDPSSERGVKHGIEGDSNADLTASGAAYVYRRVGTTWVQEAYLKSSGPAQDERFGDSVAIADDTIVVGSPFESGNDSGVKNGVGGGANVNLPRSGAVYVFRRTGTTWVQEAYIKAVHPREGDKFGFSVAVSADTLFAGALYEDSDEAGVFPGADGGANDFRRDSGAVYVFRRTGSSWSQEAYLKAHDPGRGDWFGYSVAISGDLAIVGAPMERSASDTASGSAAGAAYVFARTGTTWQQEAYLKTASIPAQGHFGLSVAISGNTVVVGEPSEPNGESGVKNGVAAGVNNLQPYSGAAHVYIRSGSSWMRQAYLKSAASRPWAQFGSRVAIDGETIVVGAHEDGGIQVGVTNGTSGPTFEDTAYGSANIFRRTAGLWQQEAFIRAHNPGWLDDFSKVAISGDMLVVGSPDEDSDATGIDSTLTAGMNDNLQRSGAAYTFTRAGVLWSADAFLKRTARN